MGEGVPLTAFRWMDEGAVVWSCLIDARPGAADRPPD